MLAAATLVLVGTGVLLAQDRSASSPIYFSPLPATNVYAKDITETSALIVWNAGSFATSYQIQLNSKIVGTTNETQFRVSNLEKNTAHTIVIYAINERGTSQSISQTFRTSDTQTVTEKTSTINPLNVHYTNLKATSVKIQWEPSSSTANYTVYAIKQQTNLLDIPTLIPANSVTKTSAIFENLDAGIAYNVFVNAKGIHSSTSPSLSIRTLENISTSNTQASANTFLCQDANTLFRTRDFQTYEVVSINPPISKIFKYTQQRICLAQSGQSLFKSIDSGKTWTNMNLTTTNHFVDAIFVDGKYIVADYNNLYESTNNGSTWKVLFYAKPNVQITKLYQNNSVFVVNGSYTNLWFAQNLKTFTDAVRGIDIGNKFYGYDMILAENQLIGLITDLINTYRIVGTTPGFGGLNISSSIVANPYFVPMGLVYDGDTLVCAVFTNGTGSAIQYSEDLGLSWIPATGSVVNKSASDPAKYPPLFGVTVNTIHYNGSTFAFIASDNTVHTSNDGKIWTQISIFPGGLPFEAICYEAPDYTNSRR